MSAIESVIKNVKNEWDMSNWGNTSYNVLGVRYATRVFKMCAGAYEQDRTSFPFRPRTHSMYQLSVFIDIFEQAIADWEILHHWAMEPYVKLYNCFTFLKSIFKALNFPISRSF